MTLLSRYNPLNDYEQQYEIDKRIVRHSLFVSILFVLLLWIVKVFESEFDLELSDWGILPHSLKGLKGILFSPLIHSGFGHLAANTVPLLILTFSLFFFYRKSSYTIFFLIYFLSGCFVWLFGREAWHIGASGIIYGLAAFLFLSGILSNNIRLLTISLIVAFVYGYMFWGIFPIKPEISWESHLWGGVTGFGMALLFWRSVKPHQEEVPEDEDEESQDDQGEKDNPDFTSNEQ